MKSGEIYKSINLDPEIKFQLIEYIGNDTWSAYHISRDNSKYKGIITGKLLYEKYKLVS